MASKVPQTGSVPTVHVASVAMGVAPPVPKGKKDPCRHRRNKKKMTKFVVYRAAEKPASGPTPQYYVGRTRGTGTAEQIINKREQGHHRTDIGKLVKVCETDSYSACRGAEQKHYADMVANGKAISSPRKKGTGAQIAPIAADNPKKQDYLDCAKASAQPSPPRCAICAA